MTHRPAADPKFERPPRGADPVTAADDVAAEALKAATPRKLLRTYARLTHLIHAARTETAAAEHRAARDLIEAELMSRLDPAPTVPTLTTTRK